MVESVLLKFDGSAVEYKGAYCARDALMEFSAEKYYNLCRYMSSKGRCLLNKESLDELFKIYVENKRWLKNKPVGTIN